MPEFHLSCPDYLDWKRENKVFSSLNIFTDQGFMEEPPDGLRRAGGARVSDGFFKTLGVTPVIGRDFYYGEDHPEAPRTTLLSYSAWQRRCGVNPDVLGTTVVLDQETYTIIGVLPRDFSFAKAEPADFWAIEKPTGGCEKNRGCHNLFGIARLKDGVTFAAALADVKAIARQLEKQYPDSNRDQWGFLRPMTDVFVGDIRPILLTMLCGAGLLLIIAGVNVSSLLLVRAETRKHEMAIRGALGASPRRLAGQYATEGLLLAAMGTMLGVLIARVSMGTLVALIPKDRLAALPFLREVGFDTRVAAFTCILGLLTAALFALTPLARLRFTELREGLTQGGRTSAGVVWRRFGSRLVVIELATATVLLAGAELA